MRHYLWAQSQGHHTTDRLEERRWKKMILLERMREGHRQSDFGTVSKATFRKAWAFLSAQIPSWTELNCTLSGMLAHYGSNTFVQRSFLIVVHVRINLWLAAPSKNAKYVALSNTANSKMCFNSIHLLVWKGFFSYIARYFGLLVLKCLKTLI